MDEPAEFGVEFVEEPEVIDAIEALAVNVSEIEVRSQQLPSPFLRKVSVLCGLGLMCSIRGVNCSRATCKQRWRRRRACRCRDWAATRAICRATRTTWAGTPSRWLSTKTPYTGTLPVPNRMEPRVRSLPFIASR
jgi:hypothetical protein